MSGIVGYINNIEKAQNDLLSRMSESIRYTENDRTDSWSDGFLAISRVHHGVINPEPQLIFNEDKSLFIVMEGEVFDYEEQKLKLVRNGHKFEFENNDVEYCLHLYEEMGKDVFKELNGSFCISIYNLITHELLLVNDRFSSRPLFYCLTDKGTLLFGTQLSAILQSSEVPRKLNMRSIFEFFTFQKVLGTKTFYKDVNILPPATVLRYREGNISLTPYWEMKYKEEKHPEEYYVDKLAEAIKKAVMRRTQGNYRFGLLLSGGLDSRTVLAASNKKMVCFTVGDFENREVKIARRIAEAKGCEHIFLKRDLDHYANLVDKAVEIGNGMYSFVHAHNIGFLDEIRKECDVLLHGYGLDFTFQGLYLPVKKLSFGRKNILIPYPLKLSGKDITEIILRELKGSLFAKNPGQLFVKSYSETFNKSLIQSIGNILWETKTPNSFNKWDYFVFSHLLAKHFTYLYLISIKGYMDERTIIFDNDLFDVYLRMPPELRFNGTIYRRVLKKINPRIAAIPNANTGLPSTTPVLLEWTITMAKSIFRKMVPPKKRSLTNPTYTQGSWPNFAELIRHNEKLKNIIENTINDPECFDPSIFNITRIKEMFEEHLNGKADHTDFLFLLLTFGRWHKKYGPKSSGGV